MANVGTEIGTFLGSAFNPLIGGTTKTENKVTERPDEKSSTGLYITVAVVIIVMACVVGWFMSNSNSKAAA